MKNTNLLNIDYHKRGAKIIEENYKVFFRNQGEYCIIQDFIENEEYHVKFLTPFMFGALRNKYKIDNALDLILKALEYRLVRMIKDLENNSIITM